jgi:fermentation-respiration switch protein FrsA (DUF1100 family)
MKNKMSFFDAAHTNIWVKISIAAMAAVIGLNMMAVTSWAFLETTTAPLVTLEHGVHVQKVFFPNRNITMVGNLFLPANMEEGEKYPALVVAHPAGSIKEQSSGTYAEMLSRKGFVTLAYDASHQGESGGEPRFLENPLARVEDIRSAVDYLTTLPFVDTNRIGAMGLCAGGGYSIDAAMTERRIKAVAGVSATDPGAAIREGWDGNATVEVQIELLEAVANQRTAEANGAAPMYITYVPNNVNENTSVTMREANEYYRTPRAKHPNSPNKVLFTSLDKILAYSAFYMADTLLTQPLLVIVGSESDSLFFSERIAEKTKGESELFVIEGATHVDLYDIPQYVNQAIEKLGNFFTENL